MSSTTTTPPAATSNTSTSTTGTVAAPSTISTTANYCGDQYANKGCACRPQVTAGLTPATQEAANTTLICAYQENGIQYGCDAGCCPGGTCSGSPGTSSAVTATAADDETATGTTRTANPVIFWVLIALSILFGLFLIGGLTYASTRTRKP